MTEERKTHKEVLDEFIARSVAEFFNRHFYDRLIKMLNFGDYVYIGESNGPYAAMAAVMMKTKRMLLVRPELVEQLKSDSTKVAMVYDHLRLVAKALDQLDYGPLRNIHDLVTQCFELLWTDTPVRPYMVDRLVHTDKQFIVHKRNKGWCDDSLRLQAVRQVLSHSGMFVDSRTGEVLNYTALAHEPTAHSTRKISPAEFSLHHPGGSGELVVSWENPDLVLEKGSFVDVACHMLRNFEYYGMVTLDGERVHVCSRRNVFLHVKYPKE